MLYKPQGLLASFEVLEMSEKAGGTDILTGSFEVLEMSEEAGGTDILTDGKDFGKKKRNSIPL